MNSEYLLTLFKRDLTKLKTEIELYQDESQLWLTSEGISNCAGNLCIHIIGNLNHFIGFALGHTGYTRKRDLEFGLKDVPRDEILKQIDDTIIMLERTLKGMTSQDLEQEYTHNPFKHKVTTAYFLMHLSTHLVYHLGQINYHRRLLAM
jgi:hypothetical protein